MEKLFTELNETLNSINLQIVVISDEARRMGIDKYFMRDTNGGYIYPPLVTAKANVLCALVEVRKILDESKP